MKSFNQRKSEEKAFAVFDIDGTVARGSLFLHMIEALHQRGLIEASIWQSLNEARQSWLKRSSQSAYDDYLDLAVEALYSNITPGLALADYEAAVAEAVEEFKDFTYCYPLKLIKQLHLANYDVLALSGSPDQAVALFAQHHNFDYWQGSQYLHQDAF